ncbi:hypothetical protein Tco_0114908 [Tanacetum coccineum]
MANVTSLLTSLCTKINDFSNPNQASSSSTYPANTIPNPRTKPGHNNSKGVSYDRPSLLCLLHFVNPDVLEETSTDHVQPTLTQIVQETNSQTNNKSESEGIVNNPKNNMNLSFLTRKKKCRKKARKRQDLCANKEKLEELANTPLSENCSAVILENCQTILRTHEALIDVYDEKLILRDGNESLTLNMQSEKSKLNGIQKVESINMIDIFNVPNYIGFKDLFAQMYSGNPTIQSNDSFSSSSPMKTSDSTFKEFTDKFTLPNSSPPGDDVSILKNDFQEETFRIISNPLFEFNDSFKSSNVNPLFEENNKDVEIKFSFPSHTYFTKETFRFTGIDPYHYPSIFVVSSSNLLPLLSPERRFGYVNITEKSVKKYTENGMSDQEVKDEAREIMPSLLLQMR